jgi:hypothetical protein
MRRVPLILGLALCAASLLLVVLAWVIIVHEHQKKVENQRFIWGEEAKVQPFTPLHLVNPSGMPEVAQFAYLFAGVFLIPGAVSLLFARLKWRPVAPQNPDN